MPAPILYCGDTNLEGAASYLAGLMTHFGWDFDYVPSHVKLTAKRASKRKLFIFSDYPASNLELDNLEIPSQVEFDGAGLLMIGGWESFHGQGGNWEQTSIHATLPVDFDHTDDRVNFDQSAVLCAAGREQLGHPILSGLPWETRPPLIGGMNRVTKTKYYTWKKDVLLKAIPLAVRMKAGRPVVTCRGSLPALVVGSIRCGRTAAFMSDVAPHWVGGFVDWGPERVKAQAARASAIEVGSHYAQFWKQLLSWVGRLE